MNSTLLMLLRWAREGREGAMCAWGWLLRDERPVFIETGVAKPVLESWEHQYARNIINARFRGVSA